LRYGAATTSADAQANMLFRSHDKGDQAEPEEPAADRSHQSGRERRADESVQVYGFLQLPVYQYVNGVQLTAKHAVTAGITMRFLGVAREAPARKNCQRASGGKNCDRSRDRLAGVAHDPPRSTYWPHMNLPLSRTMAPARA